MIILADFDPDVQHYQRECAQRVFPCPKTCPQCTACDHLIGHGSYPRNVCDSHQAFAIRVKRWFCKVCRRTVALLPSFCLPHRHYLAAVIQRILDLRFHKRTSWATIRRHFAPSELPALSICRAWVKAFGNTARHALATLLQQLATWQQEPGKLELLLAELGALGEAPAQLIADAAPRGLAARERLRAP